MFHHRGDVFVELVESLELLEPELALGDLFILSLCILSLTSLLPVVNQKSKEHSIPRLAVRETRNQNVKTKAMKKFGLLNVYFVLFISS